MSGALPKGTFSRSRSGFALIDPSTNLYQHKLGRANHVAISYVWSDWPSSVSSGPTSALPEWDTLRARLLQLVGHEACTAMKILTGNASTCWLDCKCIDQENPADKAYWIPRMDEVYSEARCTVLLVRGISLKALSDAEQWLACPVDHDNHSCLLTQSCASITSLKNMDVDRCISILNALSRGRWRRRAWIFQEIMLSREYVISGENDTQITLENAAVLAGLLFYHYPSELEIGEFADWCRQLYLLRSGYLNYELCTANVFQIAQKLEATVPADKYYALCGVLRLKDLHYNAAHSSDEALAAVISGLTAKGVFTWAYAIPPSIGQRGLCIQDGHFTPYVWKRQKSDSSTFYARPNSSMAQLGFSALEQGQVLQTEPLSKVLQDTIKSLRDHGPEFQGEKWHMASVPAIIAKLAADITGPLLSIPLLDTMTALFAIKGSKPESALIWALYSLQYEDLEEWEKAKIAEDTENIARISIAISASRSLKERIQKLEDDFEVVWWCQKEAVGKKDVLKDSKSMNIALAYRGVGVGSRVYLIRGSSGLLFTAVLDHGNEHSDKAQWRGMLWELDNQSQQTTSRGLSGAIGALRKKVRGERSKEISFSFFIGSGEVPI